MINRRATVYCKLPEELTDGKKGKEAKMAISISITAPKEMEGKKASKFIDGQIDEASKAFKKFIDKRADKLLGE